jgi:hypothetical protein
MYFPDGETATHPHVIEEDIEDAVQVMPKSDE